MLYQDISGVPDFECEEFNSRQRDYVVLIPIINEGNQMEAKQEHNGPVDEGLEEEQGKKQQGN